MITGAKESKNEKDYFNDAITAAFEEQDLAGVLVEKSDSEGKYDAKDGKLYLSAGLDYEVDESMYIPMNWMGIH